MDNVAIQRERLRIRSEILAMTASKRQDIDSDVMSEMQVIGMKLQEELAKEGQA